MSEQMTKQPTALRLAEWLDYWQQPTAKEAAAELRRLHEHELANNIWHEKTQWVQDTCRTYELGMHRADVLKARIAALEQALGMAVECLDGVARGDYDGNAAEILAAARAALEGRQ